MLHLFFFFLCIGNSTLCASNGQESNKKENLNWSFEFIDCSISDALNQISNVTGVGIFIDKEIDRRIYGKLYIDKSIEDVAVDLLSGENYALIRRFNVKKKLASINIWILYGTNRRKNLSQAMLHSNRGKGYGNFAATNNHVEADRIKRNVKKSSKNNPFAVQGESTVSSYNSKINIKSEYNKPFTGGTPYYKDGTNKNLEQGSSPVSSVLPPKPPQLPSYGGNDLESPPMPPGF